MQRLAITINSSLLLFVIIFASIIQLANFQFFINKFNTSPSYTLQTNLTGATALKISTDQDMIIVGYADGKVKTFSMYGKYLIDFSYHKSTIVDIVWIPTLGPVTLDDTGNAVRWSKGGQILRRWILGSNMTGGMDYTTQTIDNITTYFLAFNTGSSIVEYQLSQTQISARKIYNIIKPNIITSFKYAPNLTMIYIAHNLNLIQQYQCSSAMPYSNGINTSIIESMSMIDNGSLITLTRDKEISKFLIFPSSIKRQQLNFSSNVMATCPKTNLIVLNRIGQLTMDVHGTDKTTFYYVQNLTYMTGQVKLIDCSKKFLVTLDDKGLLAINTYYQYNPSPNPYVPSTTSTWTIVQYIAGGIIVIIILVCICRKICEQRRVEVNNYYNIVREGTQQDQIIYKNQISDEEHVRRQSKKQPQDPQGNEDFTSSDYNPYRKSLVKKGKQ